MGISMQIMEAADEFFSVLAESGRYGGATITLSIGIERDGLTAGPDVIRCSFPYHEPAEAADAGAPADERG